MKKIYEVEGIATVTVKKRVKAHSEEEAMELAENLFGGVHCFCGNGGVDKLIGVYDASETIEPGDYVEWENVSETTNEDYDYDTDDEEDEETDYDEEEE